MALAAQVRDGLVSYQAVPGEHQKPRGSRIQLESTQTQLNITIPRRGLTSDSCCLLCTGFVLMVLPSSGVLMVVVAAIREPSWLALGPFLFFGIFGLLFGCAGYSMAEQATCRMMLQEQLTLDGNNWTIKRQHVRRKVAFDEQQQDNVNKGVKVFRGPMAGMIGARVVTVIMCHGKPAVTAVELVGETFTQRLERKMGKTEQLWLVDQINDWLVQLTGHPIQFAAMPAPSPPYVMDTTTA